MSIAGELEKLEAMRERGILSDADFEKAKAKLLAPEDPAVIRTPGPESAPESAPRRRSAAGDFDVAYFWWRVVIGFGVVIGVGAIFLFTEWGMAALVAGLLVLALVFFIGNFLSGG